MTQFITIITEGPTVRDSIISLSNIEDTDLYEMTVEEYKDKYTRYDLPIDLVPSDRKQYPNVLCALADGWKLLGPPDNERLPYAEYTWYLVREID